MAQRRTDRAVSLLRDIAREQSNAAPPGYEHYGIDWSRLTPREAAIVCRFADALREMRENELDLLRLSTVDYLRAMTAELQRQSAMSRGERGAE